MNETLKNAHFERITDEKARKVYEYLCDACDRRVGGITDADQMLVADYAYAEQVKGVLMDDIAKRGIGQERSNGRQKYWQENDTFHTDVWDFSKPKYYVLDMFPYPSGVGLHAGHPEGYTATDIMSRMKRMQGYNVLHPMGYDSFGLPAEQYAVTTGHHPDGFTQENIKTFGKQLHELGFDYDWSKMVATSDPKFYKWTQWIFKQLYLAGYAKYIEVDLGFQTVGG